MAKVNINQSSSIVLSTEQELLLDRALEGHNVLVNACVGSGKTTTIQRLCDIWPRESRVLYLTYNRLLKFEAQEKIKQKNVTVQNYHGFAYGAMRRMGIQASAADSIQLFNQNSPDLGSYDLLIIDEYQDIDQEISEMLQLIKESSPDLQIVAVGDMVQKIYDRTSLDLAAFIEMFMEEHLTLDFTQCFRLSTDYATMLSDIWGREIVGVNPSCEVSTMDFNEAVEWISKQKPDDLLCMGPRRGDLARALNHLEHEHPANFNKETVFASIRDQEGGATTQTAGAAIFTTFDGSKGMERDIAVLFDYTELSWAKRKSRRYQKYEILRNVFLVAASRGKKKIIFVNSDSSLLSAETLKTPFELDEQRFQDLNISTLFDFKYKEDIQATYKLLDTQLISKRDKFNTIKISNRDALIDLSPCIGNYQEAVFFDRYDVEAAIEFTKLFAKSNKHIQRNRSSEETLDEKILLLSALETGQDRYYNQVSIPFVEYKQKHELIDRLSTIFSPDELVQVRCRIDFFDPVSKNRLFSAHGMIDVVRDNLLFELKFVDEISTEHFLQCATYMVARGFDLGILWNTRTDEMYEVRIPDRALFMNAVTKTITKGEIQEFCGRPAWHSLASTGNRSTREISAPRSLNQSLNRSLNQSMYSGKLIADVYDEIIQRRDQERLERLERMKQMRSGADAGARNRSLEEFYNELLKQNAAEDQQYREQHETEQKTEKKGRRGIWGVLQSLIQKLLSWMS